MLRLFGCMEQQTKKQQPVQLAVYTRALQAITSLRSVVAQLSRQDRSLADQLRRAASSILLNLAEGYGSSGGNKRLRYTTALGSQREVIAALDSALAWGLLTNTQHQALFASYDHIGAMLYRLLHPNHTSRVSQAQDNLT